MQLLDHTFASPAENLACDEALLNWAEQGGGEALRFWEPRDYFVVVGYANRVETEVNVAACAARNVPILRRCSGGGTVLQGPGCLNYAVVLQIAKRPALANISSTNTFVMERNCGAIEPAVRNQKPETGIAIKGHTDLTLVTHHSSRVTPRKFSGNSQRRFRRALLFHGTFLLDFNLPLITEFLRMPSKQPGYRNNRPHGDFLVNLNLTAARLKKALTKVWGATGDLCHFPESEAQQLAVGKYSTREWNFKL